MIFLQTIHTVEDLHPATWYVMKVIAHSDAGSTESELKFATLNYHGRKFMYTISVCLLSSFRRNQLLVYDGCFFRGLGV